LLIGFSITPGSSRSEEKATATNIGTNFLWKLNVAKNVRKFFGFIEITFMNKLNLSFFSFPFSILTA